MQDKSLLCPLVEWCRYPCEAKVEEALCKFILYIRMEHTAADHQTNSSRYLSVHTQDCIRNAVKRPKTTPMNTAAVLVKKVQDSPTKNVDPKLSTP